MFTTEEIVGDIIFISFKNPDRYSDIGLNSNYAHFLVRGYDNLGIWVSHPGLIIKHLEGPDGKPIKTEQTYTENIKANFLISWDNINTIMHYPGREGYDFPSEFDKNFGFALKTQKNKK